jgi:hypothetical protein
MFGRTCSRTLATIAAQPELRRRTNPDTLASDRLSGARAEVFRTYTIIIVMNSLLRFLSICTDNPSNTLLYPPRQGPSMACKSCNAS